MIHDDPIEALHDARDLVAAQHNRDTNGHPSARDMLDRTNLHVQYAPIQEQQGTERLVLGRGGNAPIRREPGEKSGDLRCTHVRWMALPVKDESANPIYISALGSATVMLRANRLTNAIKELWRAGRCNGAGSGLAARPWSVADSLHRKTLSTTMASSAMSGQTVDSGYNSGETSKSLCTVVVRAAGTPTRAPSLLPAHVS